MVSYNVNLWLPSCNYWNGTQGEESSTNVNKFIRWRFIFTNCAESCYKFPFLMSMQLLHGFYLCIGVLMEAPVGHIFFVFFIFCHWAMFFAVCRTQASPMPNIFRCSKLEGKMCNSNS